MTKVKYQSRFHALLAPHVVHFDSPLPRLSKTLKNWWKVVQMHYHLMFGEDSMRNKVWRATTAREVPGNRILCHFLSSGATYWKIKTKLPPHPHPHQSHLHKYHLLSWPIWCWSIECTSFQVKCPKRKFL